MAGLALQTVARAARGGQTLVKWGMCNVSSVVSPGSGVEVAQARFGASVLCSASMPHVSVLHVSLPCASVSGPLSTDHLGPTRAFRPAERCICTCVSTSPACGTGRHRIGREGCGDAAVQHVWSGLSTAQQYGCAGRSCTHDRCGVGGGHGCARDAAVGQAWRKRRGRQPVSLPPPACLVAKASQSFCHWKTLVSTLALLFLLSRKRLQVFRAQSLQICKEATKLLLYGSKTTTQRAKKEKEKGCGERDQINTSF